MLKANFSQTTNTDISEHNKHLSLLVKGIIIQMPHINSPGGIISISQVMPSNLHTSLKTEYLLQTFLARLIDYIRIKVVTFETYSNF